MWRQMTCLEPAVTEVKGLLVFLIGKGVVVTIVPVLL